MERNKEGGNVQVMAIWTKVTVVVGCDAAAKNYTGGLVAVIIV